MGKVACQVNSNCLNNHNCFNCAFDENGYSPYGQDLYNPIDKKIKHPIKVALKKEYKDGKAAKRKSEKAVAKQSKDKDRQVLLKKASKAEAKVIKTLNSGRVGMDGDMKSENLTIDAKLQSKSKDWHIKHDEWAKVQADAARANREFGVLAIINKDDETVYVVPEELFLRYL